MPCRDAKLKEAEWNLYLLEEKKQDAEINAIKKEIVRLDRIGRGVGKAYHPNALRTKDTKLKEAKRMLRELEQKKQESGPVAGRTRNY